MAQSLSNLLVHIVFSTKEQRPFLQNRNDRERLHRYMAGIATNRDCPALIVGGVEDHVHVLCHLARTMAVADLVRAIKRNSSKWLKTVHPRYAAFRWQTGYGAFSVSSSNAERVHGYISRQEEHHRKRSFREEYIALLDRHRIDYDERFVLD